MPAAGVTQTTRGPPPSGAAVAERHQMGGGVGACATRASARNREGPKKTGRLAPPLPPGLGPMPPPCVSTARLVVGGGSATGVWGSPRRLQVAAVDNFGGSLGGGWGRAEIAPAGAQIEVWFGCLPSLARAVAVCRASRALI